MCGASGSGGPTRIFHSRTSFSRVERSFLVSLRAAVRLFVLTTRGVASLAVLIVC